MRNGLGADGNACSDAPVRLSAKPMGVAVAVVLALSSCSPQTLVPVDAQARPIHRYSFGGVGTNVVDSVGTADGRVVGAQLTGQGGLTLAGGTGDQAQYVVLPPR